MPDAPESNYRSDHATALDRARYALGDTGRLYKDNVQVWLLKDETILAEIHPSKGYRQGVAFLADGLITRFAQEPDEYEEESGLKVRWNERIDAWERLAARMRSPLPIGESPAVGGSFEIARMAAPDLSGLRMG